VTKPDMSVDEKWIWEVANTPDTDLRAHRIALTYYYLARQLDAFVNGRDSVWDRIDDRKTPTDVNASWFNFATWATVTVNRDLSLRRSPAGTSRLLPVPIRRSVTPLIFTLRASDGQRVSRALSFGQRAVFVSVAFAILARMGTKGFGSPTQTSVPKQVRTRVKQLGKWDTCEYVSRTRHLQVIWDAMEYYQHAQRAHTEATGLAKPRQSLRVKQLRAAQARCMLLANLMIGAVEQDILDAAVNEVIDQVPALAESAFVRRAAMWGDRYLQVPREITGLQLPWQLHHQSFEIRNAWARFVTDQVLVYTLPAETLRLGRDVPPRRISEPFYPPDLSDLTTLPQRFPSDTPDEWDNYGAQACRLVLAFDRSRDDGRGSAARDWRRYDERMNWAVTMFRSRQQDVTLFWSPYSAEDQDRIRRGNLPLRGGDPSDFEVTAPVEGLPSTDGS
jgi:hypothetical protein